jgi:hypothetical protein
VNDILPHKRSFPPTQFLNGIALEGLKHAEIQGIFLSFDFPQGKQTKGNLFDPREEQAGTEFA